MGRDIHRSSSSFWGGLGVVVLSWFGRGLRCGVASVFTRLSGVFIGQLAGPFRGWRRVLKCCKNENIGALGIDRRGLKC